MTARRGSFRPTLLVALLVMIAAGLLACGLAGAQDLPGGPDAPNLPAGPDTPPPATPPPASPPPSSPPPFVPPAPDPPPVDPGPTAAELEAQRQAQLRAQRAAAARRAAAQRKLEAEQRVGNAVQEQVLASSAALADSLEVAVPPPVYSVSRNKDAGMLVLGLLGWVAVVAAFAALERRRRTVVVILSILTVIVLDVTLYSTANDINGGIFNPGAAGMRISLVDALIVAALVARLLSGRLFQLSISAVWWFAFIGWIAVSGVIGVLNDNSMQIILFEGRVVLYVLLLLVAASVPVREYLKPLNLAVLLIPASLAAAVLIGTSVASVTSVVSVPGLTIYSLGTMGADAASVFAGLGVIALSLAFASERGRGWLLLAAGPLIVTPLFASQRAALIGVTASVGVLLLVWLFSATGRRRRRLTGVEGIVAGLCVAATVLLVTVVASASNPTDPRLPGVEQVEQTFNGRGKASSAASRVNQWSVASSLVGDEPLLGHGLGVVYPFYAPGTDDVEVTKSTHNIGLDLLVRTGIVGLAVFLIALLLTFREGLRAWIDQQSDMAAALALASCAVIVALFSKGMVESLFEKYRLMTFLGVMIGISASAFLASRRPAPLAVPERDRVPAPLVAPTRARASRAGA